MAVSYDKFEMPKSIVVEQHSATQTFARFIAEPFERGLGHTIGSALRRMLLTSLEAPAVLSFFIEGIHHEYMAIEGIVEDVTHIALNFKGALLRKLPLAEERQAREHKIFTTMLNITAGDLIKGSKVVTLGELIPEGEFDIINGSLPIFTVTKPMTRRVEVKVAIGRGYVPSERQKLDRKILDEIVLDSAFSPVRLVNYFVENTRVGQITDYDRLVLEVTTDGRISPTEAMAFAAKILIQHLTVFSDLEEQDLIFDQGHIQNDDDKDELMQKLVLGINEIELSVRSTNCLNGAQIETIGELVVMSEAKLLQFRNFGKKSLNEIKDKLSEMGLYLGMDLSRFGITMENVREVLKQYKEEQEVKGTA